MDFNAGFSIVFWIVVIAMSITYLMDKLINFEDTVITAAEKEQPHIICNYIYELASLFHSYYSQVKFITDDKEYTNERMILLQAIKIVINNSLNLIGIIPREQM